jgi:protein-L-isoaspartate(D-aspartate) O-methyltransferase
MLAAEHIEHRGIRDPKVLRVMRSVPRHEFVPTELAGSAYDDCPLDIGFGATISQPYIVAAMTELLEVSKLHRVLEIGTGSGYQTAILAELAGQVFSIEVVPELAAGAVPTLHRLGYGNVRVRQGDGYRGWPEAAPFDRILLTAAPADIPQTLVDQLSSGGRLIAPIGRGEDQQLVILDKSIDGSVDRRTVFPVLFVPMVHPTSKSGI